MQLEETTKLLEDFRTNYDADRESILVSEGRSKDYWTNRPLKLNQTVDKSKSINMSTHESSRELENSAGVSSDSSDSFYLATLQRQFDEESKAHKNTKKALEKARLQIQELKLKYDLNEDELTDSDVSDNQNYRVHKERVKQVKLTTNSTHEIEYQDNRGLRSNIPDSELQGLREKTLDQAEQIEVRNITFPSFKVFNDSSFLFLIGINS